VALRGMSGLGPPADGLPVPPVLTPSCRSRATALEDQTPVSDCLPCFQGVRYLVALAAGAPGT
jgi:hypothetical protein